LHQGIGQGIQQGVRDNRLEIAERLKNKACPTKRPVASTGNDVTPFVDAAI